ncbi:MAG: cytochrome c [Ignavibacteria bacterium]|nr:cytochrome c [Ignavibacteria bacterium]
MRKSKIYLLVTVIISAVIYFAGCGGNDPEMGIGPVKEVSILPEIDQNLVVKGKQIFDIKCVTCHNIDTKLVGPALKDVTKRRKPEWIMNMILNPEQMIKENMIAKTLSMSGQYPTPMTFQNVTQDDARALLEFLRNNDK